MKDNDLSPTVRPLDELDDGELNRDQPSETVNIRPPVTQTPINLDDGDGPPPLPSHQRTMEPVV